MSKIDVLLLTRDRPVHYLELQGRIFNKLSRSSKDKIRLFICPSKPSDYLRSLFPLDIDVRILPILSGQYMDKVTTFLANSNELVIKFDDDCFMGPTLWDNLIESHMLLDDERVQLITPLVSTNIPLVDVIDSLFLSNECRSELHSVYLKTRMPSELWGVDYSELNKCTIQSSHWNPMMYYGEVLKVKSVYKGIHPIRLSLEACKVLFHFFAKNFNLVDGVKSSQYIKFSAPYFTNNLMLIKRNTWIRGLQYPSDGFDEVPLSLMCDHQSMIRIALTGGVCIHPMYNTVYSPEEVSDFCESDGKSVESRMIATLSDKFSEIGV